MASVRRVLCLALAALCSSAPSPPAPGQLPSARDGIVHEPTSPRGLGLAKALDVGTRKSHSIAENTAFITGFFRGWAFSLLHPSHARTQPLCARDCAAHRERALRPPSHRRSTPAAITRAVVFRVAAAAASDACLAQPDLGALVPLMALD